MRKFKERDERKRTLDTRIYPVVRIATKAPLRPRCWSTHEKYRFPAIKSLPWTQSRSPWSRSSLREIAHEGGVSDPRTMSSTPLHTKPEGRWLAGELLMLQGAGAPRYKMVHSRTSTQGLTPCSHTLSRANPSTNTHKACAKSKNLINFTLEWLGGVLQCAWGP